MSAAPTAGWPGIAIQAIYFARPPGMCIEPAISRAPRTVATQQAAVTRRATATTPVAACATPPLGVGAIARPLRGALGGGALGGADGAHPGLAPAPRSEGALGVAVPGGDEVLVLPRVGVEDGERAEAAPLLGRFDHRHRHAVEALVLHGRVEVAHVPDRAPHDVQQPLHEAREGPEPADVRQLARDRCEQVD